MGQFRATLPPSEQVVGATKWCVFKRIVPTRAVVLAAVQERMDRMGTNSVDLLQANYSDQNYLTALRILVDLKTEGLISAIGLCNFGAIRTDEICTQLGPGAIVSNQVQVRSLPPPRLHEKRKDLPAKLICGGFLADKWLGEPEPDLYSGNLTPSQRKVSPTWFPLRRSNRATRQEQYLDMIVKAWGSWSLFQSLLSTLRVIGDRHGGLSIANIATRWVLDHPFVGAVIIGARLGLSEHPDDNQKAFGFNLTDRDNADIEAVLAHSNSRTIITSIGDCGAEYR
ncbi:hypothetical protein DXG03_005138 [Asterophora parasitica]|uniref:NADP-dependent oxidoreductase domain-containing protein n=1 Tax=Asterophora parasitica TaxID=117018 RepID=A0A9P7KB41_9AGAR|nr:hypothetical protein DXG03_005138 [Asterophora parasitica]